MTRRKFEKIELRVSQEQKDIIKTLAIDSNFDGVVADLLKAALVDYVWKIYPTDKAKELSRIIDM